jgi:hypothetical protein
MPQLPMTLATKNYVANVSGLLDIGAAVNVLPFNIGLELGGTWDENAPSIPLAGNLAHFETRVVFLFASISNFDPVRLIFLWTRSENAPLLLGQTNFFMEFDVCFYRSRLSFEIQPKQ